MSKSIRVCGVPMEGSWQGTAGGKVYSVLPEPEKPSLNDLPKPPPQNNHCTCHLINQEVRKALDSIEVPEKHKETWYNKNLITHEQEVRETGIRRHNQAIDEYTANTKEVRKRYE